MALGQNADLQSPLLPLQPRTALITNNNEATLSPVRQLKRQANSFYTNLESYSNTTGLTRELHRIIIKPSKNEAENNGVTIASDNEFQQYAGRIIRNISITRLQPFGQSVNDTLLNPHSWIEKTGNKVHKRTRENIIRNQLLIDKDWMVDPELLSDNERIIRSLPYIEDVQIVIKPVNNDSVDLVFVVKDVWSVGFDFLVKSTHSGKLEIYDKNIAGTGTQLSHTIRFDNNENNKVGYEGSYNIPNIYNSFITAQVDVISAFHQNTSRISANRNFFSKNINTAGGFSFQKTSDQITINDIGPQAIFNLRYNRTYAWLGQQFQLSHTQYNKKPSIVIATSVLDEHFSERPPISESSYQTYHNKTQYLATIALMRQDFYKTTLLNSFGRTEDIPVGYLHQLTLGIEKSEYRTRMYSELEVSHGQFINQIGYFYLSGNLGGYKYNNTFIQSTLKIRGYAFSNLIIYNRLKMRYFINANYTNGFNRFYDEYLTLNDDKGIRGYNDPYLRGDQKLNFNVEHITFTPWSYLDFKLAIFSFVDAGWIGRTAHSIFSNPIYSGFGFGFRFRNERLVFKTIQIRFAYYPVLSNSAAVSYFLFSSTDRISPSNFYVQPPVIQKFE